ncbi:MAG: type IV pilin N-terminal domain-containing protein [Euryarchaeota archaeon]|nr:type IV pilin N-terminal domain-containing protein [Euryarchaeota archaeon]
MRKRTRPFTEDCDAVSEIIGELLMVVIAIITFGALAAIMPLYMEHSDTLHVDVDSWVDVSADTIHFRHSGGEAVEAEKLEMILNLNGTLVELSSDNVTVILGKSLWQLGDIIEINAMDRWGIDIEEDDYVGGITIHKTTVIVTGTLLGEKTN